MGIPKTLRKKEIGGLKKYDTERKVRILHSPSDPLAKGTAEIISAIENLRKKGHLIELVQLQQVSNNIVLKELDRCDFVVDQMYSDTPLAAFATEAALFGKPAVVGGYFSAKMQDCIDNESLPPSLFVEPELIESAIEKMIVNVGYRIDLGEKARAFVSEFWNPKSVANRYLKLLNGVPNPSWWFDPKEVSYIEGGGLPRESIKKMIGNLIAYGGKSALQIDDKPELLDKFCCLVNGKKINTQ